MACDKLIRAICTGNAADIDSACFSQLSSNDVTKLRALKLEGDDIKYANSGGMWGCTLALNILLNEEDEKKVRALCGDSLSLFMLSLVCGRVDIARKLLSSFSIAVLIRTANGRSVLDFAPQPIKAELLRRLDQELQNADEDPDTDPGEPDVPVSRSKIDALGANSSLEELQAGLRDLERYVTDERGRLTKEKQMKSLALIELAEDLLPVVPNYYSTARRRSRASSSH